MLRSLLAESWRYSPDGPSAFVPAEPESGACPSFPRRRIPASLTTDAFQRRSARGADEIPSSASIPFHMIWTPMHSRMNADSRKKTAVPVGPSHWPSRREYLKQAKIAAQTITTPISDVIAATTYERMVVG